MSTEQFILSRPEAGYVLKRLRGGTQLQIIPLGGDRPENTYPVTLAFEQGGAAQLISDLSALYPEPAATDGPREELRAAGIERRKLKEETEKLTKELAQERESREQLERDLSRALGYIDRVVEDEPPVKDPVTVINRHCGDIGESFVTRTPRRGPVLSGSDPWR